MATDAYQEWLTANSARAYPFAENASRYETGASWEFPQDAILDLRGFTRQEPVDGESVALAGLVGPTAPSTGDVYEATIGKWTLVFRLAAKRQPDGAEQFIRVAVASGSDLTYPDRTPDVCVPAAWNDTAPGSVPEGGIQDAADGAHAYLAAYLRLTLAEDFNSLMPGVSSTRYYFNDALVEPTLVPSLWHTDVDRLRVGGTVDQDVKGDVVFRGGYNVSSRRLGSSIQLSPARGAGKGGHSEAQYIAWTGGGASADLLEVCDDYVRLINGEGPDENGEFHILGAEGVTIRNYPTAGQIYIDVEPPSPNSVCPDLTFDPEFYVIDDDGKLDESRGVLIDDLGNPIVSDEGDIIVWPVT